MGGTFVPFTAALGALGLSACSAEGPIGSQPGPPRIVDIHHPSARTLVLQFSEEIGPTDGVDSASFRLSLGFAYDGADPHTRYEDLMHVLCEAAYENYCVGHTEIVAIEADEAAGEATLTINAWSPVLCDVLAERWTIDTEANILLHHRAGEPPIVDRDGEPLASIAEHWVGPDWYEAVVDGYYPFMDPLLPIPCES